MNDKVFMIVLRVKTDGAKGAQNFSNRNIRGCVDRTYSTQCTVYHILIWPNEGE